MPEEKKQSFMNKLSSWIKGWGVFMAVVGIGATLFIKLEVLTFSNAQMKYETEQHTKSIPNDVEVYKQSVKFVEASEELTKTRDSLTKYAKQITTNKKNAEDAIKSRAKRDSLLQLVLKAEEEREKTVEKVVETQSVILKKLDSIKNN